MTTEKEAIRSFTISNLLVFTTGCALVCAAALWLGPDLSFALFATAYAFAPTIAIFSAVALSAYPNSVRWSIAGATLVAFAIAMMIMGGMRYGSEAIVFVFYGTAMEWPGQIAVLLSLRLIWKAGADSRILTGPCTANRKPS